jgi:hypothetical protein
VTSIAVKVLLVGTSAEVHDLGSMLSPSVVYLIARAVERLWPGAALARVIMAP